MKACIDCAAEKPLANFYVCKGNSDGRAGVCKECHKRRMKTRRRTNPAVQAYDRARSKTKERIAAAREVTKRWRLENPEAYRAQTAVGNALRDGKLTKGPCATCGSTDDVHGHHDDYSKPLDVRWLCALHHHRHHADEGSACG